MESKFMALAKNWVIRGSKSEQVLFNLANGIRYELTREQFDFLTQATGQNTLKSILRQYDQESQSVIGNFVSNLQSINALNFTTEKTHRDLPQTVVPDIWLEAVHLENSSKCNLRCKHCYQGKQYPISKNLTFEEIFRVADEMKAIQVQGISVSGGEPFCQDNIFDIVRLFEEKEIRIISFFTNGTLINRTIVEKLLNIRSNPTVFISLDSIDPEGMIFRGLDARRGKAAVKRILSNIELLKANNLRVVINTVMNNRNIGTLKNMYDVIRGLQIDSWRIGYPKQTGFFLRNSGEFGLSWGIMADASFGILQHHFRQGKPFHLQMEYLYREELLENFQPLSDEAFVCDYEGKRQSCCLKPNGDIVSCAYCTSFPIGNIRKQPLTEIWYSKEMQTAKEIRIKDVAGCRGCKLVPYCATGCRINAYFLNGDFYHAKDDYACQAVKFFVENVMPFLKSEGAFG